MTKTLFARLPLMLAMPYLAAISFVPSANASTISGALTADNAFFAYISTSDSEAGTMVAQGNDWPSTFTFSDYVLTSGQTYYLHIQVINYGGPGGLLGQFTLSDTRFQFGNHSQTLLTDTTDWRSIYNDANDDPNSPQPWLTPTDGVVSWGTNGVDPWYRISGIDSNAKWIDGSTTALSTCQFCTLDFSATISPVPEPGTMGLSVGALAGLCLIRIRRFTKV